MSSLIILFLATKLQAVEVCHVKLCSKHSSITNTLHNIVTTEEIEDCWETMLPKHMAIEDKKVSYNVRWWHTDNLDTNVYVRDVLECRDFKRK